MDTTQTHRPRFIAVPYIVGSVLIFWQSLSGLGNVDTFCTVIGAEKTTCSSNAVVKLLYADWWQPLFTLLGIAFILWGERRRNSAILADLKSTIVRHEERLDADNKSHWELQKTLDDFKSDAEERLSLADMRLKADLATSQLELIAAMPVDLDNHWNDLQGSAMDNSVNLSTWLELAFRFENRLSSYQSSINQYGGSFNLTVPTSNGENPFRETPDSVGITDNNKRASFNICFEKYEVAKNTLAYLTRELEKIKSSYKMRITMELGGSKIIAPMGSRAE